MDSKTLDCLVCDAGACTVRVGRAEDFPTDTETPHVVVPSCVSTAGDVIAGKTTQESVTEVSASWHANLSCIRPFVVIDSFESVETWVDMCARMDQLRSMQTQPPTHARNATISSEHSCDYQPVCLACLCLCVLVWFGVKHVAVRPCVTEGVRFVFRAVPVLVHNSERENLC